MQLNFAGGSSVRVTAPLTGALAGFVVFLDPAAPAHQTSIISGSGAMYYEGVIYLSTQTMEISGSASTAEPSPLTLFLDDKFKYSGTSQLNIGFDPDASDVPLPMELNTLIASIPIIVY